MLTRRVSFRLYPNRQQEEKLHYWRKLHKLLYNACVYQRTTDYRLFGKSVSYYDNPKFLANTADKVKRVSQQKRRKRAPNRKKGIKASKRWGKAQKKVSKLQSKVARQAEVSTSVPVNCGGFKPAAAMRRQKLPASAKRRGVVPIVLVRYP